LRIATHDLPAKLAEVLGSQGRHAEALHLVTHSLDTWPHNEQLLRIQADLEAR
jgi:hypothetical protein